MILDHGHLVQRLDQSGHLDHNAVLGSLVVDRIAADRIAAGPVLAERIVDADLRHGCHILAGQDIHLVVVEENHNYCVKESRKAAAVDKGFGHLDIVDWDHVDHNPVVVENRRSLVVVGSLRSRPGRPGLGDRLRKSLDSTFFGSKLL